MFLFSRLLDFSLNEHRIENGPLNNLKTDNTGGVGRSCEKTHISEDTQKLWKRAGGWLPVVVVSDVYE